MRDIDETERRLVQIKARWPQARLLALSKATMRPAGHVVWKLNARLPRRRFGVRDSATVIIPSYSAARVGGVEGMVRSILRCAFVERVVVSNHNPAIRIEDHVRIADPRLVVVNQPTRRGCGYGWIVARDFDPAFLISIDDDMRLRPAQLAALFRRLLAEPAIPHGLVGRCGQRYHQNRNMEVDNLNQVYAVTRAHLLEYARLVELLTQRLRVPSEAIEFFGDDIVLSHSGTGRPKIHDLGPILRSANASDPAVATHCQDGFFPSRDHVRLALLRLRPEAMWDLPQSLRVVADQRARAAAGE